MPTVLIVGASRGIGLELAGQYAKVGWRVHATTRDRDSPGALGRVPGDVCLHALEVTDDAQIAAVRDALAEEAVDVLIHNAGVYGDGMERDEVMRINAGAPLRCTRAFMACVLRGAQKRIVLVSSQMGARRGSTRSLGVYGDSKAALNDAFRRAAPGWADSGVVAVVMHPGWVRTDMGGGNADISVQESATGIRDVVSGLTPEDHGRFLTWDGREHPW